MSDAPVPFGMDRFRLRLDRQDPYLTLHFIMIFVRDQERSLRFYRDQLGFRVTVDHQFENGVRWIEVAPPDGSANLALVQVTPGSDSENLVGRDTNIYFLSEDVIAKYNEWNGRGVRFLFPPRVPEWGGFFTRFEDPDANSYGVAGFDEFTHTVESQRRVQEQRLEAERRAAQEVEIAKQVQARLFPQVRPPAKTLEYAGLCLQARQVGGDYFDFLDLGQQRLGLVIGDVSGKGIAAALLMANLQANLRSQCALALTHPELFLRSVNKLFYENTVDSAYASLFFAEYDDDSRRLRYANCGHLSGIIMRGDNACCRLPSTGTLLGLFQDWECKFSEFELAPGDLLTLYTDGVTEALNERGEEFGEENLIQRLRHYSEHPCEAAVEAITNEVRALSPGDQHDDITLIMARCKAGVR
jgi:serine phosphatase RsbU (regulator of sigma subunit)/catechol 2,3-dioxygenase-like lactoylglutathione lyase family enzyme